jgi:hypothetical protein
MASEGKMPDSPNYRWSQFSLRTVFVVMLLTACVLAIFRQRREIGELRSVVTAHGLKDSAADLSPGEFRVQVRKLSNSMPPAVYEVVIETIGEATVTVTTKTSMLRGWGHSTSNGLTRSSVLIVADEILGQDGERQCRYFVQAGGPNGISAGGPGVYRLPKDKPLKDSFEVVLKDGVYPRDKPLPMSVFDTEVTTLDVH